MMNVTIYGSGYVGLVTGACLAELGHDVLCVDIDASKIQALQSGIIPIYEPGLPEIVARCTERGSLHFTTDVRQGVLHGALQFIAVNTPPLESGAADLSHVFDVAESIAAHMTDYRLIINKSTVPVGTARLIKQRIDTSLDGREVAFDVASNPEFLKEGMAVNDFMHPDRILIGCENDRAEQWLRQLYEPILQANSDLLIVTDIASAEMSKYASNAMLAARISFMNEMAKIAERVGADIEQVRRAMSLDPRIGSSFLRAGCGYGGSCLPKDVTALQHIARQVGVQPHMLEAIDNVNRLQRENLFGKIHKAFKRDLSRRVIAVWGLAFKPETNDMREASSIYLLRNLWNAGAIVKAYDPIAMPDARKLFGDRDDLIFCESAEECCSQADALVVVTEWQEFIEFPLRTIKDKLSQALIFDGRNIYDPVLLHEAGFEYFATGRSKFSAEPDAAAYPVQTKDSLGSAEVESLADTVA